MTLHSFFKGTVEVELGKLAGPLQLLHDATYRWPACNLSILASRETEKLAYGMRDCIPQPRPALLFLFSGTGRHALAPRSVHDGGISTPILYAVTVYRSTF